MWKPFPKRRVSLKRKLKVCNVPSQQEHDRRHGQVCDDLLRARPAGQRAGSVSPTDHLYQKGNEYVQPDHEKVKFYKEKINEYWKRKK